MVVWEMPRRRQAEVTAACTAWPSASPSSVTCAASRGMPGFRLQMWRSDTPPTPSTCRTAACSADTARAVACHGAPRARCIP